MDNQAMRPIPFEEIIDLPRILRPIFYIAIGSALLVSLNMLQGGIGPSSISVFILSGITLVLFGVFIRGNHRAAGIGLLLSLTAVTSFNLAIAGGIHDNVMVIFPILITFAGLLFGKRIVPTLTLIILIEVSIIYWLTRAGVVQPFKGRVMADLQDFITVVILLLVSGVLIWVTINILEKNYHQLVDSERKLRESYDQTILGWGHALELFDRETEGHSQRVTQLTLDLAGALNLREDELVHIQRGTLLHDIGKMGVPEEVLNKPGPLTAEERSIVQQHPIHAYNLLKGIPYLQKALEIPFCHHERWDGNGYPRKLKGEEIPLPARIFAITDNWDALTNDRPYRKAWTEEAAVEYLRSQKGKKFDPEIVEAFLGMVEIRGGTR